MKDFNIILADRPGLGRVHMCECRSIHLKLGPVTVTLAPEAFAQAGLLIRDALEELTKIVADEEIDSDSFHAHDPRHLRFTH
ncbi:hypothetical protein [Granulicella sp. dw_53]|uniref:hypothetical protein n=1 Tax=Granulicella sp. dw_53 TaxID=2719792 RepID=UPI001BD523BA|nr:hypothetical protein [Granulicella sp. dw_53]